jgi:hypothetical protein
MLGDKSTETPIVLVTIATAISVDNSTEFIAIQFSPRFRITQGQVERQRRTSFKSFEILALTRPTEVAKVVSAWEGPGDDQPQAWTPTRQRYLFAPRQSPLSRKLVTASR